jgi:hypothetical protein
MTPDLLAGSIFDPQSLNRYAYTRNDPINLIDPLGLESCAFIAWTGDPDEGGGGWQGFFCGAGSNLFRIVTDPDEKDVGGGGRPGTKSSQDDKKAQSKCDASLPSDTDASLLSRLIFAEATPAGKLTAANSGMEMAAIAFTVINRANHLQNNPSVAPSFFGATDSTIQGVVTPSQFGSLGDNQFQKAGTPEQLNSVECAFLKSAIQTATGALGGRLSDPFMSRGGVFGFRTAGSGAPGGSFFQFPPEAQIPGSGNTFFGVNFP